MLAPTAHGALHYEILDRTSPWRKKGLAILFHHGIGSGAENKNSHYRG